MRTCFVIQPFDRGPFDKRFEDVFEPAITKSGLTAYRVDRDPRVSIPIDEIEKGIEGSAVCLAEITKDNPNVWFELGYAIASHKEVVLICSDERTSNFPFDIQHRSIIRYRTDSLRDFTDLQEAITTKINAILAKAETLEIAAKISPVADVEGLAQHEMVALVSIAENADTPQGTVSIQSIRQDMERSGFTRIATMLALGALLKKELIQVQSGYDAETASDWTIYWLTQEGLSWLLDNQQKLVLRSPL